MMTITELAEYLSLHVTTVRKYAAQGRIPAIRIGRVGRFDKEAIDLWIAAGQNNPVYYYDLRANAHNRVNKFLAL